MQVFRERGDVEGASTALCELSTVHSYLGDPRSDDEAEEAVALLDDRPGEAIVTALTGLAGTYLVNDMFERCAVLAGRALGLAEELRLPGPLKVLGFRGGGHLGILVDLGRLQDVVEAGVRIRDECLAQGFTARAVAAAASTARALGETGATAEALTLAIATRDQVGAGVQPAIIELAAGELVSSAPGWRRAYALLGRGRCLTALGNPAAEAALQEARSLFAAMGARTPASPSAMCCSRR